MTLNGKKSRHVVISRLKTKSMCRFSIRSWRRTDTFQRRCLTEEGSNSPSYVQFVEEDISLATWVGLSFLTIAVLTFNVF